MFFWNRLFLVVCVSLIVLFLSCDSDSPVQTLDDFTISNSLVSDCGGFDYIGKAADDGNSFDIDPTTYCDAEKLHWIYINSTKTLKFMNTRVVLNCCGDHAITAANVNGEVVVSEDDQPQNSTGRCNCMCVF